MKCDFEDFMSCKTFGLLGNIPREIISNPVMQMSA